MRKFRRIRVLFCMAALTLGLLSTFSFTVAAATSDTSSSISGAIPTDGTGTVIENDTDTSAQREFFTIKTPAGNVFYIVVDKEKTSGNVYLLTPVTEADLVALAGSKTANTITGSAGSQSQTGLRGETATNSQSTVSQAPAASANTSAAGKKTKSSGGNIGTIGFVALAVLVVGGAGFYFKIYKPRHEIYNSDDFDEMEQEQEPEDKAPDADSDSDDDDGEE